MFLNLLLTCWIILQLATFLVGLGLYVFGKTAYGIKTYLGALSFIVVVIASLSQADVWSKLGIAVFTLLLYFMDNVLEEVNDAPPGIMKLGAAISYLFLTGVASTIMLAILATELQASIQILTGVFLLEAAAFGLPLFLVSMHKLVVDYEPPITRLPTS